MDDSESYAGRARERMCGGLDEARLVSSSPCPPPRRSKEEGSLTPIKLFPTKYHKVQPHPSVRLRALCRRALSGFGHGQHERSPVRSSQSPSISPCLSTPDPLSLTFKPPDWRFLPTAGLCRSIAPRLPSVGLCDPAPGLPGHPSRHAGHRHGNASQAGRRSLFGHRGARGPVVLAVGGRQVGWHCGRDSDLLGLVRFLPSLLPPTSSMNPY